MKKVIPPNVRKVYGATNQQQESQMNAVRKIHNLLSSGAVTVTGPTQPRILKQKVATISGSNTTQGGLLNSQTHVVQQVQVGAQKCYICDDAAGTQCTVLTDAATTHSNTKLTNKVGQILGDTFMVIISVDDVICKRCLTMLNHLDRLENDIERVKANIINCLYKKYNLSEEGQTTVPSSPPVKMQKLNSGNVMNRRIGGDDEHEVVTRKIIVGSRDAGDEQHSSVVSQPKTQSGSPQIGKKGPVKLYKCMQCDFKTIDLKQFQPHYETCVQKGAHQCKTCKKMFTTQQVLKQHIAEKHSEYACSTCNMNFTNELTLKKHIDLNHPEMRISENVSQLYSCGQCQYKTTDKNNYEEHQKKHVKLRPFKCKLCSHRFETREQAGMHAKQHHPNYFKCGSCSQQFHEREQLVEHFKSHTKAQQQQQQQSPTTGVTTQKLLQETIDEALRDTDGMDNKGIHFLSCNHCSLTFIQESYYNHHMEMHKAENSKQNAVSTTSSQSLIRQEVRNTNANTIVTTTSQGNSISDADIESIFEKMHSDKGEGDAANSNANENLVITRQQNAVGGITFNITIPQSDSNDGMNKEGAQDQQPENTASSTTSDGIAVGIDMPVLDQPDESSSQAQIKTEEKDDEHELQDQQQQQSTSGPVSMPSLDDDGDSQSQPSNTDQVPMDLEDMQNSVEGNQIKFILNENGQILQLDNHIITTDADGNQILVQGTDSEQIQQLLQSVGVLQTGDGLDGETLQMIGDNNQMIIVQQGDNEAQLIDASLLNADGHIVIQQAQDGELSEGAHAIGEDGVRIPVSVAFTEQQGDHVLHGEVHSQDESENHEEAADQQKESHQTNEDESTENNNEENITPTTSGQATVTTTQSLPTSTGESFFALEDLMQQPEQKTE